MTNNGDTHYYRKQRITTILKWLLFFTYIGMYFSLMAIFIEPTGQEMYSNIFYSSFVFWFAIKLLPYNTDLLD